MGIIDLNVCINHVKQVSVIGTFMSKSAKYTENEAELS